MTAAEEQIAHLLRRTSFGPFPGQVEKLLPGGVNAAIDTVLNAKPITYKASGTLNNGDTTKLETSWLQRMINAKAGLHEKMVWFWHGHFTSSSTKVPSAALLAQQHNLLRAYALGNFREFAYQVTIDPAMLVYLDGAGSIGDAPNENYSRELMELFTISRLAGYTQDDVIAGAKALSGWRVEGKLAKFSQSDAHNGAPLPFLGTTVSDARDVIDAVCDHPACAPFIAGKLYRYLAGIDPTATRKTELANVFTSNNLEIKPLVEAILRGPEFLTSRLNRPRFPVEWIASARMATGYKVTKIALELCENMGQIPFQPPNVAGWGPGSRWLSASQVLARTDLAVLAKSQSTISNAADPVDAALRRCQQYEVSASTRDALDDFAASVSDSKRRAIGLLAMVVASPEFALA